MFVGKYDSLTIFKLFPVYFRCLALAQT